MKKLYKLSKLSVIYIKNGGVFVTFTWFTFNFYGKKGSNTLLSDKIYFNGFFLDSIEKELEIKKKIVILLT